MRTRRHSVSVLVLAATFLVAAPFVALAGTQLWDFEDGADDWDSPNGSWEVNGGVYQEVSGGEPAMHSVIGEDGWTDYVIDAQVRIDTVTWAGIAFRVMSDFEYYVYYFNSPDNKSELWKHNDGAFDARNNIADIPAVGGILIENGTWLDVQVVVEGDLFELWVDGELQSEDTDASYSSGKIGVWTWASTGSFDDVSVTGDGIIDTLAVQPQDKLATAWATLKGTR